MFDKNVQCGLLICVKEKNNKQAFSARGQVIFIIPWSHDPNAYLLHGYNIIMSNFIFFVEVKFGRFPSNVSHFVSSRADCRFSLTPRISSKLK